MNARRHGAAGVRRGIRGGGGASSIRGILGPAYRLEYDSSIYTPGTAPDIAAIADQADIPGDGSYDAIALGTASRRPHSGDVLGYPGCTFDGAQNQYLDTGAAATNIMDVGDYPTLWVVFRMASAPSNLDRMIDLSNDAAGANTGTAVYYSSGRWYGRSVLSGGTGLPYATFSDTTAIHLLRYRVDGTDETIEIDGTAGTGTTAGGGLSNTNDRVVIGWANGASAANTFDGTIYHAAWGRGCTNAQVDAVDRFLAAKYGVTLA